MATGKQGRAIHRQGIKIRGQLIIYRPSSLPERDEDLGGRKGGRGARGRGIPGDSVTPGGWIQSPGCLLGTQPRGRTGPLPLTVRMPSASTRTHAVMPSAWPVVAALTHPRPPQLLPSLSFCSYPCWPQPPAVSTQALAQRGLVGRGKRGCVLESDTCGSEPAAGI